MMGKEQIKKLAMQAGEYTNEVYVPPVRSKTPGKIWEDGHVGWHDIFNEKFAELVAAHEREACAKMAENCFEGEGKHKIVIMAVEAAKAIRARGNHA